MMNRATGKFRGKPLITLALCILPIFLYQNCGSPEGIVSDEFSRLEELEELDEFTKAHLEELAIMIANGKAIAGGATSQGGVSCPATVQERQIINGLEQHWGISANSSFACNTSGQVISISLNSRGLIGTIPSSLGSLSNLAYLNLNWNKLSGTIPSSLGSLSKLTHLNLNNNQLSGTIPSSLGNLSNLAYLNLNWNQLSGTIPSSLGSLSNLTYLYLFGNQLSGTIPSSLGNLSNLRVLHLGNNQLSGTIPSSLGNLSNLTSLYLGHNKLSGTIPSSLGNLSNLEYLEIQNNQLSGIPSSIGNLSNLTYLYLHGNQLRGIPSEIGNLSKLVYLHLHNNQLSGTIPSSLGNLSNLKYLKIQNNQLSGTIPSSLGNLSNLTYLYLDSNQLSGTIPSSLGNLSNLIDLWLGRNQLSGTIPSSIGNLLNLVNLVLNDNQLTGSVPDIRAQSFALQRNRFCLPFPAHIPESAFLGNVPGSACPPSTSPVQGKYVYLYENVNTGGWSVRSKEDKYTTYHSQSMAGWKDVSSVFVNDNLSSLRMEPNMGIVIYEHVYGNSYTSGFVHTYCNKTNAERNVNLSASYNDKVSSYEVFKITESSTCQEGALYGRGGSSGGGNSCPNPLPDFQCGAWGTWSNAANSCGNRSRTCTRSLPASCSANTSQTETEQRACPTPTVPSPNVQVSFKSPSTCFVKTNYALCWPYSLVVSVSGLEAGHRVRILTPSGQLRQCAGNGNNISIPMNGETLSYLKYGANQIKTEIARTCESTDKRNGPTFTVTGSCKSADYEFVNGACKPKAIAKCGVAHNSTGAYVNPPPQNATQFHLCAQGKGTPTTPVVQANGAGVREWHWQCNVSASDSVACKAKVKAKCGIANGSSQSYVNPPPQNATQFHLCAQDRGVPSAVTSTTEGAQKYWNWTCSNGDSTESCKAKRQ